MKYALFMITMLILSGCAVIGKIGLLTQEQNERFYEGISAGYRGPIHVQVCMSGGFITEIIVIDSSEDRFVGGAAMEELIDAVIEYNSTDVDTVSGATITSKGFLEAVNNAIMEK